MRLRFVSVNAGKTREMVHLLAPHGVEVVPVEIRIPEVQSADLATIVEGKCLDAFARVGRPLLVEHTALYLTAMNGLPGGLGQIFWDSLQSERFCELFGTSGLELNIRAVSAVGYCDGQQIHHFVGELTGRVAERPSGVPEFQWDCVFIPEGETETLAQLGPRKHKMSMRRRAVDAFLKHVGRVPR